MNIRRVVSQLRANKTGRRAPLRRRRPHFLELLEERRLLALLTNGTGPGDVRIEVNEQGAFGASPTLAVSNSASPPGNAVGDASFTPVGASGPMGAVYESGIAIGLSPGGPREFLTAGTIAGTGNNANGLFLPPSSQTPQSDGERHSRFFWPNSVSPPSSSGPIPPGAQLMFDLEQSLVDLGASSSQDGTALVQEYKVTNVSSSTLSFDLVRYFDGDLFTAVSGGSGTNPLLDAGGAKAFDSVRGVTVFQTDGVPSSSGGSGGGGGGGFGGLPTIGEVDNGTFIDNDVATSTVGYFGFEPAAGGSAISSAVTVEGRSGNVFQQQDFIFDFNNFIDVGSDGGAFDLSSTTVTMSPTLVSPDLVVSEGNFQGPNGQVFWRAESTLINGLPTVFNTVHLSSSGPLGDIRFINYLDEDVFGPSDDILFTTGSPGEPDFRAFTVDGPERVGFAHGGIYQPGSGLVNATFEGWAADAFPQLASAITGSGTSYSIAGNIDTGDLPPFNDPDLGEVFGPEDITTAFAWRTNPNANSATFTSFLELVPQDPTGGEPTYIGVQSSALGGSSARWEVGLAGNSLPAKPAGNLLSRILNGQALRNDIIPVAADADNNGLRDSLADVALARSHRYQNVSPGETVVFTTLTVFGHPPGSLVTPPPPLGTISGTKFEDLDGDGVRDSGESGVSGFQIFADLNQNGSRDSDEPFDVTDSSGGYSFQVSPGTHRVREVVPSGWIQTFPSGGFHTVSVASPGSIVSGIDFGNQANVGRIEGLKFDDENGNGVFDSFESGLSGVTIFLDENDDGQLTSGEPSTFTDSFGDYAFANLAPGSYVVREVVPSGRQQTFPSGDGAHRVTVSGGQTLSGLDFGNRVLGGAVSGFVWNDLNRNGIFEPSELRVGGVIVYVDLDDDGARDGTEPKATSNSQGMYTISDVAPGSRIVRQEIPSDSIQTFPSEFHSVNVLAGQTVSNVNFGNVKGEIRGVKFADLDGNGSQGPSEFGISSVTIYLDLDDDAFLDATEPQTLTDSSGGYVFQNLAPDSYVVREIVPQGFVQTAPGGDGARRLTLSPGQIVSGQDFGNQSGGGEADTLLPLGTPEDVDGSGVVDLRDLVAVIAAVRTSQEQGYTSVPADPADVTGDQRLLLNDVLRVVQHLRNLSPLGGEGEGEDESDSEAESGLAGVLDLVACDVTRRRR
jgi:hypothetical protein